MCFSTAKWKREEVPDHKFDYVDVTDFYNPTCTNHLLYLFIFAVVFRMVIIYILEFMNAFLLLLHNQWSVAPPGTINNDILEAGKYIYVASIVVSYILLALDVRKARRIIKSRDISFAYTSPLAYEYYCLTSYKYFCFFQQISNASGAWDNLAFFVFFAFKGWKRLFLAELPRHAINAFILQSELREYLTDLQVNFDTTSIVARAGLGVMLLVFVFWALRFVQLVVASVLYVPLVFKIRGNLKEYSCHKIDKRISEILKKRARHRIMAQRQQSYMRKRGHQQGTPHSAPQPTLPDVGMDLEVDNAKASDAGTGEGKLREVGYDGPGSAVKWRGGGGTVGHPVRQGGGMYRHTGDGAGDAYIPPGVATATPVHHQRPHHGYPPVHNPRMDALYHQHHAHHPGAHAISSPPLAPVPFSATTTTATTTTFSQDPQYYAMETRRLSTSSSGTHFQYHPQYTNAYLRR